MSGVPNSSDLGCWWPEPWPTGSPELDDWPFAPEPELPAELCLFVLDGPDGSPLLFLVMPY